MTDLLARGHPMPNETRRMPGAPALAREGGRVARRRRGAALALCVAVLRPPMMALTRRDWRGAEHLPPADGCVVVTNHISNFDPLVIAHFLYDNGRLPRFLVKSELFEIRVVGKILRSAGQIPVIRRSVEASRALTAAVAAVERGECLIVYPEGTITRDPGLWPMTGKTGAARIALATGCPVVPLAQWGAQAVLAHHSRRLHLLPAKTMHVLAGPPVELDDLRDQRVTTATLREATARITAAVTELLAQLRSEKAPSVRFDSTAEGEPQQTALSPTQPDPR